MLEQKPELNHASALALELMRQKRLAYFCPPEPVVHFSGENQTQLSASQLPQTCENKNTSVSEQSFQQSSSNYCHGFPQQSFNNNIFFSQPSFNNKHSFPQSSFINEQIFPRSSLNNEHVFPQPSSSNLHNFPQSNPINEHGFPHSSSNNEHSFPQSSFHSNSFPVSNSNNTNYTQFNKKPKGLSNQFNLGRYPSRPPEALKSTTESLHKKQQNNGINSLNLEESLSVPSHLPQFSDIHSLTKHLPEQWCLEDEESIGGKTATAEQGDILQGVSSDKSSEDIICDYREKGLQSVVMKVARDKSRSRIARWNELRSNQSDADIASEISIQESRSSSSSSGHSLDTGSTRQPPCRSRQHRNKSPHRKTKIITKNLQQLKEGEKDVNMMVRNYNQITTPTNTKSSFSAEEIYKQAFGGCNHLEDNHINGHSYSTSYSNNYQDIQASKNSSNTLSYSQRKSSFQSNSIMPPNFSQMNNQNQFTYPPPNYKSNFSMAPPCSLSSSESFESNFLPQAATHPVQKYFCGSSNTHFPSQHSFNINFPPPHYSDINYMDMLHKHGSFSSPSSASFLSYLSASPSDATFSADISSRSYSANIHKDLPLSSSAFQINLPSCPPTMQTSLPSSTSVFQTNLPLKTSAFQTNLALGPYTFQSKLPSDSTFHSGLPSSHPYNIFPQSPKKHNYPFGIPQFTKVIPLHLPPPPIPPYINQHSYVPQQQPPLPSSSRRSSLSQPGGTKDQVSPEQMMNGQYVRVPHPPLIPPPLQLKDGLHNFSDTIFEHGQTANYNDNPTHHEAPDEDPKIFNLRRYFSSLEVHHGKLPNSSGEPSVALNPSLNDLPNVRQSTESAFTGISTEKAGGVTQRLKDLDIDINQLKHLRNVDMKGGHSNIQTDFEILSKGVKSCPECGSKNKAYMNWCMECGELIVGVELVYPEKNKKCGNAKKKKKDQGSKVASKEKNFICENIIHVLKPVATTECGNIRYPSQESPESGRGLPATDSPVQQYIEQDTPLELKDTERNSTDAKEHKQPLKKKKIFEEENNEIYLENGKKEKEDSEGVNKVYDEGGDVAEMSFLEQVNDPVLREFINSYKKQWLLQQSKQQVYNEHQISDVRPTSSETKKLDTKQKDLSGPDHIFKLESLITSRDTFYSQIPPPNTTQPFSHSIKDSEISNNSLLSQIMNPVGQISEGTLTKINEQLNDSGNNIGQDEVLKAKSKKKKAKVAMDVEIFDYDDIRRSRTQTTDTIVVPALNLACSSDEEEENNKKTDNETTDSDSNVDSMRNASENNASFPSLVQQQTSITKQATKDQKFMRIAEIPEKHPMKTAQTSPPKPIISKSESPLYHRSQGRGMAPANYQRHWTRSSVAWSSYKPRELSTRSSLNSSLIQRIPQKSVTPLLKQNGYGKGSHTETGNDHVISAAPIRQRASSAVYKQRRPAHEHLHRPSSAQINSSNSDWQVTSSLCSGGTLSSHKVPGQIVAAICEKDEFLTSGQKHAVAVASQKDTKTATVQRNETTVTGQRDTTTGPVQRNTTTIAGQRDAIVSTHEEDTTASKWVATSALEPEPTSQQTHVSSEGSFPVVVVAGTGSSPEPQSAESRELNCDSDSPRLLCAKLHRLTQQEDEYTDRLHVVARNAYDKYQEMTPRIAEGQVSVWQCLPDEIWLYVFNFLSHGDLKNLLLTSKYFNRLANDDTLWKYITVKPRYAMTDTSLAAIAHHHPLSLAMLKCQGHNLSLDGLHYFFKETQGRLQELSICGCSLGSLVGTVFLTIASQYCHKLTHLDTSFCHVNDKALTAISECAERLESICLNGFQSMSDSSLLMLLKKHGKSLRTLELYACFSLSVSAFFSISEYCTSLRRLCLGSCNKLTDSAMTTLSANLAHIEELDLRGCKNLKNDCIRKIVHNCPRISTLVLANCYQISDIALTEIATYLKTTLRALDVCGCNKVTDNGVLNLSKNCQRLTNLDISSTRCTSISVQHLAESSCNQWLETVKLSFLSGLLETSLFTLIHQCPRLRSIHVFGCSSLKNLARLQAVNPKLSVEGDSEVSRSSYY